MPSTNPLDDWHERFKRQARWTTDLRRTLYRRAGLSEARRILEIGSGTGVITREVVATSRGEVYGLDIRLDMNRYARERVPQINPLQADGLALPFRAEAFEIILSHYLLLWVEDPGRLIREAFRTLTPGGYLLLLAEPDYGGRIDFPPVLETLGRLQLQSLQNQGADPEMGRKLRGLLVEAGFESVQVGILGGEWDQNGDPEELESEQRLLRQDLKGLINSPELNQLLDADLKAWSENRRILFVPTFHAFARKP